MPAENVTPIVPLSKNNKTYTSWLTMKRRCFTKTASQYPYYGGRGIVVCERWKTSFANFFADMGGEKPVGYTLERTNNNGNYSCGKCDECLRNGWPANCRWATMKEQCNNRSSSRIFEFKGEKKTLTQWSEETGISVGTLWSRIDHCGWTVERALTEPVAFRSQGKPFTEILEGLL